MQPSSPAEGTAPAPADEYQSMMAQLDDTLAQAEIAANAERDQEEAELTPTASSARQEAQSETPGEEDESDEDEDAEPAEEAPDADADEAEEEEEEEAPKPAPTPAPTAEGPKYSRRDAARFATELDQTKGQLDQAQAQLRAHQGELGRYRETDTLIRRHLQQQSGYVVEQNGRYRYENLSAKVLEGSATAEEADEVAQMTQWHRFASPIYRAAEDVVLGAFKADWDSLRELEGIGPEGMQKLNKAQSVVQAAREVHALSLAAGEAKAKAKYEAKLAKLQAENKSLKTNSVSRGPQPAVANGQAVPANGSLLQRMIDPKTGLTSAEFDREVASGKWLGVELESA
jgi:hypothetical protein